ncbi:hypothetical protein, partial [Burkholderia pseudomallei]|uniref:hypothetical protein n=1 Tax=Burkholderia pseudomallei TaxID=28450 RepID=UPI001C813189
MAMADDNQSRTTRQPPSDLFQPTQLRRAHVTQCGDLPDFFGPFQSWRTASVASVEQYRCLNSS